MTIRGLARTAAGRYEGLCPDGGGQRRRSYQFRIPNRAFVLAAKAIGGRAWEKAERFVCHPDRAPDRHCRFRECAVETVSVARDLFPVIVDRRKGRESLGRCRRVGGSSSHGTFGKYRRRLCDRAPGAGDGRRGWGVCTQKKEASSWAKPGKSGAFAVTAQLVDLLYEGLMAHFESFAELPRRGA